MWSQNFTPSLNEKANFRKFLRAWFGRDLTESELAEFDTETLIGKPAQLVVVQEHKDGETYANIVACTPDKSGAPLKPSRQIRRAGRTARRSRSDGGQRTATAEAADTAGRRAAGEAGGRTTAR